jgi:hypothetical protein
VNRFLLVAVAATLALAREARGQELVYQNEPPPAPAPRPPADAFVQKGGYDVELGARTGYATAPIRGGDNPFGIGFGGRIGLAFGGFYAGVSIVDYLGGKDVDLTDAALLYGLEAGYGWRWRVLSRSALTLRFQLGAGNAAIAHTDPSQRKVDVVTSASGSSRSSSSDTTTVNNVYFEPGATLMFASGNNFAALGTSMLLIPGISYGEPGSTTWISYVVTAQLGFRL